MGRARGDPDLYLDLDLRALQYQLKPYPGSYRGNTGKQHLTSRPPHPAYLVQWKQTLKIGNVSPRSRVQKPLGLRHAVEASGLMQSGPAITILKGSRKGVQPPVMILKL